MRRAGHFVIAATSVAVLLCVPSLANAQAANVLLLGDNGSEGQVQQALDNAGHNVVYGGLYYEWDGVTPDVNAFDVVVYLDGIDYGYGLLPAADAAVSAFVAGGGGLVITEWAIWDDYHGNLSAGISALLPVTSINGGYTYGGPWHVIDTTHPLTAWLPTDWGDAAAYHHVALQGNAVAAIEGVSGNPLLTYRTDSGGTVIHVNHDMTYTTPQISDRALSVMINSVEFAAGIPPADCNENGTPDFEEFADGSATDVNGNRVLDECDPDCNGNGTPDDLDVRPGRPFTEVAYEFDTTSSDSWDYSNSCDDCVTPEIALPEPITIGGEVVTKFVMGSDGSVELLRAGDNSYGQTYGTVRDLINYGTPHHTYLLAAYDDLDSGYFGQYGYRVDDGYIVFYWETQTNDDADNVYSEVSIFQIVLHFDGTMQWNFESQAVMSHGYDLFSGLYLGYGLGQLHEFASGFIPTQQSWLYTGPTPPYSDDINFNEVPDECEPDCNENGFPDDMDVAPPIDPGLSEVPFRFEPAGGLDWSDACDTCETGAVALPFPVTLGSETYTAFQQESDGDVELLRNGDTPYNFSYGYVADLIADTDDVPGNPTHTYLLAAFDDLDSEYLGTFGYRAESDRVVFYWRTETYDDDDDGLLNEFEIILSDDSSVRWNFNYANYAGHGYDLFTGLYLGHGDQILHEIVRDMIPTRRSWIFTEFGLPGGDSDDSNENGIPDECEGKGDMNDDGFVTLDDLADFLACLQGPNAIVAPACEPADIDNDGDVDLDDVDGFCAGFDD